MNQLSGKLYKTLLILAFLMIGSNGCKKDYISVIPYVYVNFSIPIANYIELNVPGGSVYLKGVGYGGIIVVNNWGDSTTPYLAYDAACTYEASSSVSVAVKDNGDAYATCPECGSQFMLMGTSGSPIKGPAAQPLKQYNATLVNGLILIHN